MKNRPVLKLIAVLLLGPALLFSSSALAQKKKKSAKRTPQAVITHEELPIITSDIYVLERVVQSNGVEKKIPDQKSVGRFITFSSYSSLSGYDGCHWFQHKYVFNKSYVELKKQKLLVGGCDQVPFVQTLPPSPFAVHYEQKGERLTLTSVKTKQHYIYRKNVADAN